MNTYDKFIFGAMDSVSAVHFAGYADTASPRLHSKDSGFMFEYILSGEECIESPDYLIRAGIGDLIVIRPSEECVLYRSTDEVTSLSIRISGFVLEAMCEVLGISNVKIVSSDALDRFISATELYNKYTVGDGAAGRGILEIVFSLLLDAVSDSHDSKHKPTAEGIKEYLDLCLCGDVDLDSVGKRFGITGMHTIRLFRQKYSETPMQYLKTKRIEKSGELLLKSQMTIKEISTLLRFSSTQHFTNLFREHYGISPAKYRKESNDSIK